MSPPRRPTQYSRKPIGEKPFVKRTPTHAQPAGEEPPPTPARGERFHPEARRQHYEKPKLSPQVTTLWDYPSQHYGDAQQGSSKYVGATPSHVIWNVVSRFSEPGELVVDPFCGSGTTLDVCADLERKARGFDVAPARDDVENADARSLPLKAKSVDLVFIDPPYADNVEYSDDPRCIGKLKADGRWQRAMRLVLQECARVLKDDRHLAVYVCDVFHKDRGFFALGFDTFSFAKELFVPVDVIAVVRHNRNLQMGNYRKAADEGNFYLRGFNYLMLFRKRSKNSAEGAGQGVADGS
jgi:DNA modification methylase